MSKANEPAYPNELAAPTNDGYLSTCGLTKREYFAGLAMQGMLSGEYREATPDQAKWVSKNAVEQADALLAELEKTCAT